MSSPGSLSAPSKLVMDDGLILILTGMEGLNGQPNERDLGLLICGLWVFFREREKRGTGMVERSWADED